MIVRVEGEGCEGHEVVGLFQWERKPFFSEVYEKESEAHKLSYQHGQSHCGL